MTNDISHAYPILRSDCSNLISYDMIYMVIIMTTRPIYREYRKEDIAALYQLICQLEEETLPYEAFCAIYHKQLNNTLYYGLVCEYEHEVIGFIHLRLEDQLHHAGKIAEILELIVVSHERKQGIGKELLRRGCLAAKKYGCIQVEVSSHCRRSDAHRFYEQNGFQNHHKKFTKPS